MSGTDDPLAAELRAALDAAVAGGWSTDPIAHAEQVASVATVFDRAFRADGLRCVLVGGGAIEVQAPGVYLSHDIDLVVETWHLVSGRERVARVFERLGFARDARHWRRGEVYVEVPGRSVDDPIELYDSPPWYFSVVRKEVLLRDRLVGFKHWGQVAYGAQAVAMIAFFGDELDQEWLAPQLRRESIADAYDALSALAASGKPATDAMLDEILDVLHGRPRRSQVEEHDPDD